VSLVSFRSPEVPCPGQICSGVCAGGCLGAWPLAHSRSSASRENVATMLVAEDVVASVAAGSSPSGAEAPSSSAAKTYFARATFHSLISKEFEFKLP
jgi:hypothetical protein